MPWHYCTYFSLYWGKSTLKLLYSRKGPLTSYGWRGSIFQWSMFGSSQGLSFLFLLDLGTTFSGASFVDMSIIIIIHQSKTLSKSILFWIDYSNLWSWVFLDFTSISMTIFLAFSAVWISIDSSLSTIDLNCCSVPDFFYFFPLFFR